jgi:histidyl-tRNA synthetase|tara:strand:- start:1818 stop:3098 length:1281 start_codon:yes stop_codon:yes gene_type:complete
MTEKNLKFGLVRGMRDIVPGQVERVSFVESCLLDTVTSYGYDEIRLPIIEQAGLFSRGLGEATDAVEKEMYLLDDRDGGKLALRPEGTASCVRAVINAGMLREGKQRLWYSGWMFRHERPQKGRYRQFYQIGVEAFGYPGPDIDVELINIAGSMWKRLGVQDEVTLEINSIGSRETRDRYKQVLVEYLTPFVSDLDSDSRRRLNTNPLRILDSKNVKTQEILTDAPELIEFLDESSTKHFEDLCERLERDNQAYRINPRLVRGLDYYTHTVVEWTTERLGSQGTVCAGGRYDGLIEQLGGVDTPAAGFALGLERVVLLHESLGHPVNTSSVDIYIAIIGDESYPYARRVAGILRNNALRVRVHQGGGKIKAQMRQADKSGAKWAVIIGEKEIAENMLSVKFLRTDKEQRSVTLEAAIDLLKHNELE